MHSPKNLLIICTHIAKTATSSAIYSVKANFEGKFASSVRFDKCSEVLDWVELMDNEFAVNVDGINFMSMHLPFGIHKYLVDNDGKIRVCGYITFLRDPLARTLSALRHCLCFRPIEDSPVMQFYKKSENNYEFLKSCLENEINCNVMCKQLSGMEELRNCVCTDEEYRTGELYGPRHKSNVKYTDEEMQNFLEVAKYNLDNSYLFVGFQEKFDESMEKLCKKLGCRRDKSKEHKNVFPSAPKFNMNKPEIVEVVSEMNEYDIQLYKYALERWT